jgi:hypothetical protein
MQKLICKQNSKLNLSNIFILFLMIITCVYLKLSAMLASRLLLWIHQVWYQPSKLEIETRSDHDTHNSLQLWKHCSATVPSLAGNCCWCLQTWKKHLESVKSLTESTPFTFIHFYSPFCHFLSLCSFTFFHFLSLSFTFCYPSNFLAFLHGSFTSFQLVSLCLLFLFIFFHFHLLGSLFAFTFLHFSHFLSFWFTFCIHFLSLSFTSESSHQIHTLAVPIYYHGP